MAEIKRVCFGFISIDRSESILVSTSVMLLQSVPTAENLKADVAGNATLQVLSLYVFPQIIGVFDPVITLSALPHFETPFISSEKRTKKR